MSEAAPQHEGHHDGHPDRQAEGPTLEPGDRTDQRAHRRVEQLATALRAAAAHHGRGPEGRADPTNLADRLCQTAVEELGAQGATLCALFAPGTSVPVGVSDPTAARAEEVQFSAGEGPCWRAYATGEVVVADLVDPGQAADLDRLWPAYTASLRRQSGYGALVCLPLTLTSGLQLGFSVFASAAHSDRWWRGAPVVASVLREVLDAASPPKQLGGPAWLDSPSTLRRGGGWVAESLLVEEDPSLEPVRALRALRTYAVVEGLTVDAAAAALVRGNLSARKVLGRT